MARGVTGRCVQDDLHVLTRLALAVVEPPSSFTPKALHMHVDASYVNELDTAGCTVVILAESSQGKWSRHGAVVAAPVDWSKWWKHSTHILRSRRRPQPLILLLDGNLKVGSIVSLFIGDHHEDTEDLGDSPSHALLQEFSVCLPATFKSTGASCHRMEQNTDRTMLEPHALGAMR
jgi:hypothetical protein